MCMLNTLKELCLNIIIIWGAVNTVLLFFVLIWTLKFSKRVNFIVEDFTMKYRIVNEIITMPLKFISRLFKED